MVEREGKLLACAMLRPLGQSDDGVGCAEIAAFCVHPAYRGSGRGDSLLDFLGARNDAHARISRFAAPLSVSNKPYGSHGEKRVF